MDFYTNFERLTGNKPFPWQEKLFNEFVEKEFRISCPIPTGLGKTSIIALWLLALAQHARMGTVSRFPRRLVYVVNRRTVVDQSTHEAGNMLKALIEKPGLQQIADALRNLQVDAEGPPMAISTLRGQFADNAEWREDPSRPAVIVGTVDMIGSRLLFSGYGCGFKSRPFHAGLLGQDTLLVHDEAHLEPAFQELVMAIGNEHQRCNEFGSFRVMELTATSRAAANDKTSLFSGKDLKHPVAKKRVKAKKWIKFHVVDDEKKIADKIIEIAGKYKDSGQAILIFLRRIDHVNYVVKALRKIVPKSVETLTGTLRGQERDDLARENHVFARFMRSPEAKPQEGTVYLVCTSAGEVGVNISADHLVCDLTPFDSMMQRFGRVNRFGEGDACIDIIYSSIAITKLKQKESSLTPFEQACAQTRLLLKRLPKNGAKRFDASPAALMKIPDEDKQAAFTPEPIILPTSDILFDAWALTSVRQKLPGRPPVADWLHGVEEWEQPVTYVAWREEVEIITDHLVANYPPEDLLEDYPLKPHEFLRDQTKRVFEELEKIATRCPEMPGWVISPEGNIEVFSSLARLVEKYGQKKNATGLADHTVLLPPKGGGLKNGMLDGTSEVDDGKFDIADEWSDGLRRRLWDDHECPKDMRLIRTIDIKCDVDDESEDETFEQRYWYWHVQPRSADDDGSRTARIKQDLSGHLRLAEDFAKRIVAKLGLAKLESTAVVLASGGHDYGKDRMIWQRSIGNHHYPEQTLAKSGARMRPVDLTGYRHEFGSMIDMSKRPEFRELPSEVQDLVLHLIAAHHGRARPHFPEHEAFDHDQPEEVSSAIAREVPRRFARLQRKYGRWGLAYLESLVRAADIMASQADLEADPRDGADKGGAK
jgi:CRISPR-associated endonuclease/helicase Cas3